MNKTLLFILLFILSVGVVYAIPGIPHQFYGSVIVNSLPAVDGILVKAVIMGSNYTTTVTDVKYGYEPIFFVEDPNNNREGKTIKFYIGSIDTGQAYVFENAGITELGLSVSCQETWSCTDWSECINSQQSRFCTDANSCGTTLNKPAETQSCSTGGTSGGSSGGGSSGGGSSGGGGGGGGTTSVSDTEATRFYAFISPTVSGQIYVNKPKVAIVKALFKVNKNINNIRITIEKIEPSEVSVLLEGSYQYNKVTLEGFTDADIEETKITFRVERGWMQENNLQEGDIALYRYVNGEWQQLETKKAEFSDQTYVYFEAASQGFSVFSIGPKAAGTKKAVIEPKSEEAVGETTVTKGEEMPDIEDNSGGPSPITGAAVAQGKASLGIGVAIVAAIIVLGIVILAIARKKRKGKSQIP